MKYFFLLCFSFFFNQVFSQNKYDYNWVYANRQLGGNILSFESDSLKVSALGATVGRSIEALACMSDKEGNLIFYTNNCTVFDKNHQIMENGEGLNPGLVQTYLCNVNPFANTSDNSVIILPQPIDEQRYQIIHWDFEAFNIGFPSEFGPLHLYHSVVDMSQNNNLGKVVSNNNLIIADTLSSCALQAVQHANGRDWWILVPEYNGNCYYKVLLDSTGFQVVDKQCIGSNWGKYARSGGVHFTPDGSKYIRLHTEYGLNIFDFDRCTGQMLNPIHIPIGPQDVFPINSMTLSHSGRFLYYHTLWEIYQYDLDAQDINSSKILVATFDGFQSSGNSTDFYKSQLAPDGKIYINSNGPTYFLHVIEHPDSLGLDCQVKQHSIELYNSHFASMPNFPNYRMGAFSDTCIVVPMGFAPIASFQWSVLDAIQPLKVGFVNFSNFAPMAWNWDFGDGVESQDKSPVHTYAQSGAFQVCLVVSNSFGSDTLCQWVTVMLSGVREVEGLRFFVYPNPAQDYLKLLIPSPNSPSTTGTWSAYTINGQEIASGTLSGAETKISTQTWADGVYVLYITLDGARSVAKVVISRL
jgi:PKD repeat protein